MQDPLSTALDLKALNRGGIDVVRRPTGGRAVLHWNDITYSCVFSSSMAAMGVSLRQTYALLGRCLMAGLKLAGVSCAAQDSTAEFVATKRDLTLPCFLSPNRDEIMTNGKKLIGSAQKRTTGAVLQHGSMPLDASFRRLPEFLTLSEVERGRLRALLEKKCVCLREASPDIDAGRVIECMVKGFAETLLLDTKESSWNNDELAEIDAGLVATQPLPFSP
jgi:lipoate-protein ligase A